MLRNRSRTVSKQPIMADQSSLPSPTQHNTRPVSSFLGYPRFFTRFLAKGLSDGETLMSPTSILDGKQFSKFVTPFGFDKNLSKPSNNFLEAKRLNQKLDQEAKHLNQKLDPEGIGIALIEEKTSDTIICKPHTRKVLFGSMLKIQIPPLPQSAISPTGSPKSPADFGIKTRKSQFSGTPTAFGSGNSCIQAKDSPRAFTGPLSLSEMELSEDYTCVISHGPNPKTTHIYDDFIVTSCCGVVGMSEMKKEPNLKSPSQNFLGFCYTCKKNLGEGRDIYMYRGEKAFCSEECRSQEMVLDVE